MKHYTQFSRKRGYQIYAVKNNVRNVMKSENDEVNLNSAFYIAPVVFDRYFFYVIVRINEHETDHSHKIIQI